MEPHAVIEEQRRIIQKQAESLTSPQRLVGLGTLLLIRILEFRDPYTKGHSEFVAKYSVELAPYVGFPENLLEELRYGALLHDIGKVGIPDTILHKPSQLTVMEQVLVQQHTTQGASLFEGLGFDPIIPNCVLYHHESYDGSGYPFGIKGEDIPLEARIVKIVDVYHALVSERPYRAKMTKKEALRVMLESKHEFDPEVYEAFIKHIIPKI